VEPAFIAPETFHEELRRLKKKYPHIEKDLSNFKDNFADEIRLSARPIPGGENKIWKARIASTDMQRGKSGGFRLIFGCNPNNFDRIYLLKLYPKAEREDISAEELMELFKKFIKLIQAEGKQ
jgi:mRNA-degrading endonuclease RelE of RelBE toxin-antitoxin system